MVIALYFWTYFSASPDVGKSLVVNIPAVILASGTLLFSFMSYLWAPRKYIFPVSLIIYLLLATTTTALIINNGGTSSPFVSLWMLIGIFAGIFGLWGLLPILLTVSSFIAVQYINGHLTILVLFVAVLSGILPLIAGAIIWHGKSVRDEGDDDNKAFRNLANELTAVAGKSEVVINAIGDGVVVVDGQGIIQLINPAAQSIIGWGRQDALALSYKSVLKLVNQKDEVLDPVNDPIQQALNSNQEIRTNNLSLMASSGNKLMISLVASPVGEMGSGVITVFHDVTKEKADEREQAEFISTASHEMRTPVASIEGYLGLALNPQTAQIDERARNFIMKAHASAEHLGHLFQDLLDVSKSEDGRLSNKPNVINIVTFVRDVIQDMKQKAADKGLRLIYKPIPDNATERFLTPAYSVNLDNDHIREIINNLVENAIKYTPEGEIVVDVNGNDERITISVQDSGVGIPAEDISHLFQKFYRVDDKNTRDIGGTGLGLYLCRRLTEIMGGRIWVESTYSKGSTFFVELPRISNKEASRISEQQTIIAQQEASKNTKTPLPSTMSQPSSLESGPPVINSTEPIAKPLASIPLSIEPVRSVPRGQALTPEQIAEYVTKQRTLAQQQAAPQLSRPHSVSVPKRELIK